MAAYPCCGLMGKMITVQVAVITLTYICVKKAYITYKGFVCPISPKQAGW